MTHAERCRNYRLRHKERVAEMSRGYCKNYRQTEQGKAVKAAHQRARHAKDSSFENLKRKLRYYKVKLEDYLSLVKICQLCGSVENLTIDHMYPVSKGGKGNLENLQILCRKCNGFKKERLFLAGNQGMML